MRGITEEFINEEEEKMERHAELEGMSENALRDST